VSAKTFLVQCWDDRGALTNHYEVVVESAAGLRHLKKFLQQTCAHVQLAPVRKPAKPKPPAKKR